MIMLPSTLMGARHVERATSFIRASVGRQGEDAVKHASGVGARLVRLDRLEHLGDPALGKEIDWSAASKVGIASVEPLERGLSPQCAEQAT